MLQSIGPYNQALAHQESQCPVTPLSPLPCRLHLPANLVRVASTRQAEGYVDELLSKGLNDLHDANIAYWVVTDIEATRTVGE